MAAAKRKQDEKNLKILRELVSQPGNKECFDCRQRGPTYVNMSIGSFVCTSCSGMLRGLTPPHRVKSISMATFTPEEIDFIKERGNEYCKKIWLGLLNPNSTQALDAKDEQQMKDLMSEKYEAKRYYLAPSQTGNQNQSQSMVAQQSDSVKESPKAARVPQFGTSASLTTPVIKTNNQEIKNANEFIADFKADFSKTPDPFVPNIMPVAKSVQPPVSDTFFANFDNNFAFNTPKSSGAQLPLQQAAFGNSCGMNNKNGTHIPPSEDRYAALKDLDSLMKQTHLKEEATMLTQPTWSTNNMSSTMPGIGSQTSNVVSNPFINSDLWKPSANIVNNNVHPFDIQPTLCNPANPFKTTQFGVNNDTPWINIGSPNNSDGMQFNQLTNPLANRVWQSNVPAYHVNPFMVGSGMSNMTRNSNNPFL